ncbi:MAG TPA: polysaccharide biosynthesis/export family protein [Nitrospirota bacterium]
MTIKKTIVLLFLLGMLAASTAAAADYEIGEGDVLQISVWGEKDLSLLVKVRPDGKITVPAVGEVAAANTTVKDLQSALTAKIAKIVKNPIVTVMVSEITNNKVYIFGGGVNSGVYSLTQRTTLLQLLCQVGQQQGVPVGQAAAVVPVSIRYADLKNAYVLRHGKRIKQNFHNLFITGDISEDIVVEPNDAIFIPALTDKNVYVMGAVNTPRSIEFRDGLTVMGAILEAGGFTKYASQNDTVIYRKDGSREITISVKIKKLINDGDLNQNPRLQPGDYIVVKEGIF